MLDDFDPADNYLKSRERVGYVDLKDATLSLYESIGFKSGLEVHQQLKTEKKLFCHCPAGVYQKNGEYDAEVVRHMRPTLSELGEYDGTALMEFRTRKNIIYHIKYETACTYDVDDTPPFKLDRQALEIAIEIALLSKLNIVGELHITRKQYLDGSIPTGFQRTGIVGIEGELPLRNKKIRLLQLSIEEDSCRELLDRGHDRMYVTDRLGMPLIETVTYPELMTPWEAAEAAQYIRFLARSTGKVQVGIGAAREDVNVSVTGGTRVEIKGVAHISWIPKLTHNEAFRQVALLQIKADLNARVKDPSSWKLSSCELDSDHVQTKFQPLKEAKMDRRKLIGVNLPGFKGLLSYFTQPGQCFADELSGRLKVIACVEKPNLIHSEQLGIEINPQDFRHLRSKLNSGPDDAQLIFWCPKEDLKTGLETIQERCQLAFEGVPNETRKSLENGTNIFERVLPGPDRMYPDTDSAPIAIHAEQIERIGQNLPPEVHEQLAQLKEWKAPEDTYFYILRNNLMPTIRRIVDECGYNPVYVTTTFGHTLKNIEGRLTPSADFSYNKVYGLFKYVKDSGLCQEIVREMLPTVYEHPKILFDSVLSSIEFKRNSIDKLTPYIRTLREKFREINSSSDPEASTRWIMGQLRKRAVGNIPLKDLRAMIEKETGND
jgi:glutamyl-tRNA(Gln) amidotransferase subunit E